MHVSDFFVTLIIIMLSAVVINGVFDTPRDARFATFCSDYDRIQTAIQVTFYDEYLKDQTSGRSENFTTSELYSKVATGVVIAGQSAETDLAMTDDGFALIKVNVPTYSEATDWTVNTTSGKLLYTPGFEKEKGKLYITPNEIK